MNAHGKEVDTTCLSVLEHATDRGFLHRDYLAHCLRWSHVVKYLNAKRRYQTHHVLDVGCGREVPLAKLLYSSRMTHTTGSYTGVDYGKLGWPESIPAKTQKFNAQLLGKADFVTAVLPRRQYDTIVCFEVLEHVEPYHSFQLLRRINMMLSENGVAFVSTPCFDHKVGAADNHVNEMTYAALKALIRAAGLSIANVHGTFASQRDYKEQLKRYQGLPKIFELLGDYYDSNVLACLFAPLFPEQARNCIWELTGNPADRLLRLPTRTAAINAMSEFLKGGPHSSSARWTADIKKIMKEFK